MNVLTSLETDTTRLQSK